MTNRIRIKKKTIYALVVLFCASIVSAAITLVDPTAEWDKPIISILWLVVLTIAVVELFSHNVLEGFHEQIVIGVAWAVRVIYVTLNNLDIITFRGDPFFDMAHGLYYGYDHVINGNYPILTNYPTVLVGEFKIFGINRYVTCYINAFISMLAIYFLLKCFCLLRIKRGVRLFLLFCFSFNAFFILYGSEVFREPIYTLFVTMSLYYYIKWTISRQPHSIMIALVTLIPVIWLHGGYVMIAGGYIISCIIDFRRITFERMIYKSILVVTSTMVAAFALFGSWLSGVSYINVLNMEGGVSAYWEHFDYVQTVINSDAGSHYLGWMVGVSSLGAVIIYTPIRMMYFLYSPMIWDCYRVQDYLLFFTDSILFLLALVLLLLTCIFKAKKSRKMGTTYRSVLAGTTAAIILTSIPFAWGTFNSGTAIRHRNCLLPLVLVQIAICFSVRKKERANKGRVVECAEN